LGEVEEASPRRSMRASTHLAFIPLAAVRISLRLIEPTA
jgi:hypothetical protein